MKNIEQIFFDLVKIPSATGRESMTVGYIQKYLNNLGYKTWQDDVGNIVGSNCGNLYAYLEIDPSFDTVVFSAHADTVLPIGSAVKAIKVGTKMRSDGTTILGADNRAGIAAILDMAQGLDHNILHTNLLLFFPVHEEAGKMGSAYFKSKQKIKYVFNVDESSRPGNFVYASLSHLSFEIRVSGKAAHAAKSYNKGVNAIVAASKLISRLKLGSDKQIGWTMNIGLINGGLSTNVVPDNVLIKGEVRAYTKKVLDVKLKEIQNLMRSISSMVGAKFDLILKTDSMVPPFDGLKDPDLTKICKIACSHLNLKPKFVKSFSSSDANSFASLGYRVISVARGGAKPHSLGEYVLIDDLYVTKSLLERILYLC